VKDGACVFIGNHYTLFDPIYPASVTWEGIHYVAKSELFSKPILRWLLRKVKAIPANRDGNDARVMMDCLKCLKNGEKIALYPEGTRNKTDQEFLPFHHGAAAMAIKAKAPIVPIVLYKRPRFFRLVHVIVGEPLELTEYYDKKLTVEDLALADEKLLRCMIEMKKAHTEFLENRKKDRRRK
jgi:1-acyl-sn-glycerol-3-phosphate acyltransferase